MEFSTCLHNSPDNLITVSFRTLQKLAVFEPSLPRMQRTCLMLQYHAVYTRNSDYMGTKSMILDSNRCYASHSFPG